MKDTIKSLNCQVIRIGFHRSLIKMSQNHSWTQVRKHRTWLWNWSGHKTGRTGNKTGCLTGWKCNQNSSELRSKSTLASVQWAKKDAQNRGEHSRWLVNRWGWVLNGWSRSGRRWGCYKKLLIESLTHVFQEHLIVWVAQFPFNNIGSYLTHRKLRKITLCNYEWVSLTSFVMLLPTIKCKCISRQQ